MTAGTTEMARFRDAFGPEARSGVALESFGSDSGESAIAAGEGRQRLDAAVVQLRLLLETARADFSREELSEAEAEVAAVAELAQSFKQTDSLPEDGRARVRLEAVVVSDGSRPAGLVKDGRLLAPEAMGSFGELYEFDPANYDSAFAATGRISDGRRISGGGTLVRLWTGDSTVEAVLTARHVAQEVATDAGTLALSPKAQIDFNGEVGGGAPNRHALVEVVAAGPDAISGHSPLDAWDFALIRLGDPLEGGARPRPATISLTADLVEGKRPAALVSFPGQPPLRPSEQLPGTIWHTLFQGLWNVKRFSPAMLISPPSEPAYQGLADRVVLHDGTTTGGSSGGALLGIGSGQLAGIHVGGRSETANVAIRLDKIAGYSGWSVAG